MHPCHSNPFLTVAREPLQGGSSRLRLATLVIVVLATLSHTVLCAEIDLKSVLPSASQKKKYGAYFGVFGGTTTSQSASLSLNGFDYDLKERDGDIVMGIEVGHSWRTRYLLEFGLEFEALFSSTEVKTTLDRSSSSTPPALSDVATTAVDMNYAAFMLNGVINLDLRRLRPRIGSFLPRFRPYVGAGLGGAQIWYRNQDIKTVGDLSGTPTGPSSSPFGLDEFVFAYQIFGGLEFMITDRLGVYGEYRRLTFEKTTDLDSFEVEMFLGGLHLRY
jgi:opacity protein-like surface antigen